MWLFVKRMERGRLSLLGSEDENGWEGGRNSAISERACWLELDGVNGERVDMRRGLALKRAICAAMSVPEGPLPIMSTFCKCVKRLKYVFEKRKDRLPCL